MFSYLGTNVMFNEMEFFTYMNLWLLSLMILLLFFFMLVYVTLYSVTSFSSTDSLLEIFVTFGSLVILFLIISPSLLLLFDTDMTILPNTVMSMLGMQWAWESTIKMINSTCASSSTLNSSFSANAEFPSFFDDVSSFFLGIQRPSTLGEAFSSMTYSFLGCKRIMEFNVSSNAAPTFSDVNVNWFNKALVDAITSFTAEVDWFPYFLTAGGLSLMVWAVSHPNSSLAHHSVDAAGTSFTSFFSNNQSTSSLMLMTNWAPLTDTTVNGNVSCVALSDNMNLLGSNNNNSLSSLNSSGGKIMSYPLNTTSSYLIMPYHSMIKTVVSSRDVMHSYGVYSFGCKMDAMPGSFNLAFSMKPLIKGLFKGFCFELCGTNHTSMIINILSL